MQLYEFSSGSLQINFVINAWFLEELSVRTFELGGYVLNTYLYLNHINPQEHRSILPCEIGARAGANYTTLWLPLQRGRVWKVQLEAMCQTHKRRQFGNLPPYSVTVKRLYVLPLLIYVSYLHLNTKSSSKKMVFTHFIFVSVTELTLCIKYNRC